MMSFFRRKRPDPLLCRECRRGHFRALNWRGRDFVYRGVPLPVSEDLVIETCDACATTRGSSATAVRIDELLAPLYARHLAARAFGLPSMPRASVIRGIRISEPPVATLAVRARTIESASSRLDAAEPVSESRVAKPFPLWANP